MIIHYGYMDASGEYFITVDDSRCSICKEKRCITSCPKLALVEVENDYGDKVMAVKEDFRKILKYVCSECKSDFNRKSLPCISACPYNVITHSW